MKVKVPPLRIPKSLAACADKLIVLQNERYEFNQAAEKLKKQESAIKEHLIKKLPKEQASGVQGKLAFVYVEDKEIWQAKDWKKIWTYIFRNKARDILGKKLTQSAIDERVLLGKKVPGVEKIKVPVVRIQKTKSNRK